MIVSVIVLNVLHHWENHLTFCERGCMRSGTAEEALNVDNEAAIKLAKNPEMHQRTKHIRT